MSDIFRFVSFTLVAFILSGWKLNRTCAAAPRRLRKQSASKVFNSGSTYSHDRSLQQQHNTTAVQKCYSVAEHASVDGLLNKTSYLEFLFNLTSGDLAPQDFGDLPSIFIAIFFNVACRDQDCSQTVPVIATSDESQMNFMCGQVLHNTYTQATVIFEYSVSYNSDTLSHDAVVYCLEAATTNLLLDNFGCSWNTGANQRALVDHSKNNDLIKSDLYQQLALEQDEFERRYLYQQLSMSLETQSCPYDVNSTIQSIADVVCTSIEPSSIQCAIVRSAATVKTIQIEQPFEAVLQENMTVALQEAIDSGEFLSYLPSNCSLA